MSFPWRTHIENFLEAPTSTATLDQLVRAVNRTHKLLGRRLTEFIRDHTLPLGRSLLRSNLSEEAYERIYVQYVLVSTIPLRLTRLFAAACGRHVARHFPDGNDRQKQVLDIVHVVSECAEATTGRKRMVDAVRAVLPRIQQIAKDFEPEVDEAVGDWSDEAFTEDGKRRKVSEKTTRRADLLSQQVLSLDVIWYAARSQLVPPSQVLQNVVRMMSEHFEVENCAVKRSQRRQTRAWQIDTLRRLVEETE